MGDRVFFDPSQKGRPRSPSRLDEALRSSSRRCWIASMSASPSPRASLVHWLSKSSMARPTNTARFLRRVGNAPTRAAAVDKPPVTAGTGTPSKLSAHGTAADAIDSFLPTRDSFIAPGQRSTSKPAALSLAHRIIIRSGQVTAPTMRSSPRYDPARRRCPRAQFGRIVDALAGKAPVSRDARDSLAVRWTKTVAGCSMMSAMSVRPASGSSNGDSG